MTSDADFKALVRQRMAATGARYTEARAALRPEPGSDRKVLDRRVFGLKTTYTIRTNEETVSPAQLTETMFRRITAYGYPTNVYLENGGRLHVQEREPDRPPAFAGPECDSLLDVVTYDQLGDDILRRLASMAEAALAEAGNEITVTVERMPGQQQESYLGTAAVDATRYLTGLNTFLASRWVLTGNQVGTLSAKVADPLADADRFLRLVVVGADPGPSAFMTFAKLAATEQALRLIEADGALPHSTGDPATTAGAIGAQRAYLEAARSLADREDDSAWGPGLDAWAQALHDVEAEPTVGTPAPILVTSDDLDAASAVDVDHAPTTTRASLRNQFILTCKRQRQAYMVDWEHLRLPRLDKTVRLPDPLAASDERAEELIALATAPS